MIIENPWLSAIYDDYKDKNPYPPKGMTTPQFNITLFAFCNIYLKGFELVFRDPVFRRTGKKIREEKKVWDCRLFDLMVRSTLFREFVESEIEGECTRCDSWFRTKMKAALEIADHLMIGSPGFSCALSKN
jgi:hypothetical protein